MKRFCVGLSKHKSLAPVTQLLRASGQAKRAACSLPRLGSARARRRAPTTSRADILYVGNATDNTIQKFTSGGVGSVFASTGLSAPRSLAFDSAGNLYAANYFSNTIEKFTLGGVGSVFANTGGQTFGIAFDSAGNLYAANQLNNTIEKFTIGGVGSVFASASSGLNNPGTLAFDSAGNLYAVNVGSANILKFTPGGVGSVFANTAGQPFGIAFDSVGNLYAASIVNSASDTIEKFTPGGVSSVFASGLNGPQAQFLAFTNDAGVPLPLANQVPEPASALLLALGTAALLAHRRRNEISTARE